MNVVELDFSGFDKALSRGEFAEVSARLGVDLDAAVFAQFTAWSETTSHLKRARLLALIRKALCAPEGYVWERASLRGELSAVGTHVLAVKWADGDVTRVTIALKDGEGGPEAQWPELEAWSAVPAENRDRVDAWARVKADDRATVTVRSDLRIQQKGDEEPFVRAIADAPHDEQRRLAYADWLEEHGDVRAELIREQLGLIRGTTGRHFEILETSWPELAGELRRWANPYGFSGGMAESLTMPAEEFLREGERLFSRYPVRELSLGGATIGATTLERVANSPALRRLEELSLSCGIDYPLAVLGKSPHLERLKELRLLGGGRSTRDWVELFSSLRAPALESLLFVAVRTSPAVVRAIAENPSLRSLRHFNEASIEVLFPPEPFAAVKRLFRGDELLVAMKIFAARPSFTRLALAQPSVTDAMVEPFFSSSSQVSLEWLELQGSSLTDATLESLRRSSRTTALTRLEISNAPFSAGALCAFLKSETPKALRELSIGLRVDTAWTPEETSLVYDALLARPFKSLEEVKLPPNSQRDEAKWVQLQRRYTMSEHEAVW